MLSLERERDRGEDSKEKQRHRWNDWVDKDEQLTKRGYMTTNVNLLMHHFVRVRAAATRWYIWEDGDIFFVSENHDFDGKE